LSSSAAVAEETSDRHLRFGFRAGAPRGTDYEALIERPAEIRKDIDLFRAEGEWRIRALFDFHAVYPVRKGQMVEVLTQYEGSEDFVPRVEFSEVLEVTRADPPCLRQHLKLVFTALTALFMRWFSAGDVAGMMNAMYRETSDR